MLFDWYFISFQTSRGHIIKKHDFSCFPAYKNMLYERFANIPIKLLNIISECSVNVQNIYFLNV